MTSLGVSDRSSSETTTLHGDVTMTPNPRPSKPKNLNRFGAALALSASLCSSSACNSPQTPPPRQAEPSPTTPEPVVSTPPPAPTNSAPPQRRERLVLTGGGALGSSPRCPDATQTETARVGGAGSVRSSGLRLGRQSRAGSTSSTTCQPFLHRTAEQLAHRFGAEAHQNLTVDIDGRNAPFWIELVHAP